MVTLIEALLEKRELQGIHRPFAERIIQKIIANTTIEQDFTAEPERYMKKKIFQKIKKEVRAQIREVYGVFFEKKYSSKKDKYVQELIVNENEETVQQLLQIHRSTNERREAYDYLYTLLFEKTGKPESILDIGCGFNPFAYTYLSCTPSYHCMDLACADLRLITAYFTHKKVPHTITCADLTTYDKPFVKTDIVFAFKVFDSLETIQKGITKKIIQALQANYLIASFPTKSIGKKKTIPRREWFLRLVNEHIIDTISLENEEFYIITLKKE